MIAGRVSAVRDRIARAASRASRSPDEVTLVAVTKTHAAPLVREAYEAGCRDFGENRVQEAEGKIPALQDLRDARWHLIGHLQANKAKKALGLFSTIHSIDGEDLAGRLDRLASEAGVTAHLLVEVDLAGEASKSGLDAPRLLEALRGLKELRHIRIEGLMCLPPYDADPEKARPFFVRLRELRDEARSAGLLHGASLSMGMSHDLEVAVEEGATHVRVGTAIFGERARKTPPA